LQILSNTYLFSNNEKKCNSKDLIEKLSKSKLKTNPEFILQLNKLIIQHSNTDIEELSNLKCNNNSLTKDITSDNFN